MAKCNTCGGSGRLVVTPPTVTIDLSFKCETCDGTGMELCNAPTGESFTCRTCKGRGQIPDPNDTPKCPSMVACPTCGGDGEVCSARSGDWGFLPGEPCRYCRQTGCVYFLRDDGPEGRTGLSPSRCANCGRDWVPGESSA